MNEAMPHPEPAGEDDAVREPSRIGRVAVLLLLGGLIALPVGFYAVPHEIASWQMARALDARSSGHLDRATRWADRALRTSPASAGLLACRSVIRREAGDLAGSLEDAQRVVRLMPQRPMGYELRGLVRQQMGRWKEALADWKMVLELADRQLDLDQSPTSRLRYAQALNSYAYARGLAGEDLQGALEDIERAIGIAGKSVSFVDTRGYLHFRAGNLDKALQDMQWTVAKAEVRIESEARKLRRQRQASVDRRQVDRALKDLDHLQAVLLHHRGLVYLALERGEAARDDLHQAERLGFDPAAGVY